MRPILLSTCLLPACTVFDDDLQGKILPQLGESCGAEQMAVMGEQTYTLDGNSDSSNPTQCGIGSDWTGPDGFVEFEVSEAPMRMHFSARGLDGQDIALYVLSDCAENRACARAHDECGAGGPEHMTYVVEQPGAYWLGIDTKPGQAGKVLLTVMDPMCGDGMIDHAEACDLDAFPPGFDGASGMVSCNDECQLVYQADQQEENEPNDDILEAHVLTMGSGHRVIRGKIGGVCDLDRYRVQGVGAGDVIRVTLFDGSGNSCAPAQMPAETTVSVLGGPSPTTVIRDDSGMCPALETTPLSSGGDYYVTVSSSAPTDDQYDYGLQVEINPQT